MTSLLKNSYSFIDLTTLAHNAAYLQKLSGHIAPAVKANAYGVGAIPVVKKLYEQGLKEFFVAYFEEGVSLRDQVPGDYAIYVLNDVKNKKLRDYQHYQLIPVLYDVPSIAYWRTVGNGYPCVIHFDTGMHRTGAPIGTPMHALNIVLVMSHLCASEVVEDPMNQQQLALFKSIHLPSKTRRSLANSGGIFLGKDYHFDLSRPGIACYGFSDFGHSTIHNCLKVFTHILQIDHVEGGSIGYNMTYQVTDPTIVATLGIGYADGVPRDLRHVKFGDYIVPVIGRVSMDLTTIDISQVPQSLWGEPVWVSYEWPGFAYEYALRLGSIGSRIKLIYSE